jgi:hypothetical protein
MRRRDLPVGFAHGLRLREEIGALAGIEPLRAFRARLQQLAASRFERAVQMGNERQRLGRQDRLEARLDGTGDLHALGQ